MPDLLLELRSEEIPARMQRKAAGDLRKLVTDALVDAGLTYEGAREYWTPRRLALDIRGLTARSKDVSEEIKGPSTKAPEQAVQGFLRKAGLADISQAHVHTDPKKGDFYVAHISRPGRAAEEIVADVMPGIIRGFPWPKSMRWGKASAKPGSLRWVRPLQSILCTFGPETEEPVVIQFEVDGIVAGNVTYGHRFHAPGAITVRRFADYADKLMAAKVVLDAERRKEMIAADARNLAFAAGLELVEDEALLDEVSGLVEWPVVLMGEFEPEYLEIPADVIRLTIRANQKCFVLRAPGGALSNRFVLVANIEASDGGREIARGNGKVVRARLSDALYFWKTDQADLPDLAALETSAKKFGLDLSRPLDQRMAKLDHLNVTFHAKLGTQGQRVERIARLAEELAPVIAASISLPAGEMPDRAEGGMSPRAGTPDTAESAATPPSVASGDISPARGENSGARLARRAALLAKADLTTEVVGEFPELQGAIGRKYAELQGEHPSVAAAIEEHYKPQGPSDAVPTDPVSIAVALADKLDTLMNFWVINEKPTGSKDPYALRRAVLGATRIILENNLQMELAFWLFAAMDVGLWDRDEAGREIERMLEAAKLVGGSGIDAQYAARIVARYDDPRRRAAILHFSVLRVNDLLSFFHDRLKVYLKDQGARHDLIDAVLGAGHRPISPLAGEMPDRAEGGKPPRAGTPGTAENTATPPSVAAATNDDLLSIVRRVEALGAFLDTENGANLLAGAKRAANIFAAEEKRGTSIAAAVDPALFAQDEEINLFNAVNRIAGEVAQAVEREDYSAAMAALANLREPVDSFFEAVLVNAEDAAVRANRLALVGMIRETTLSVADFSRISG